VVRGEGRKRCGVYRVLRPLCVLKYSSAIVGEGACVRDYKGMGCVGLVQ
jgi:hypothetical protein